jgi:hypothetical protein
MSPFLPENGLNFFFVVLLSLDSNVSYNLLEFVPGVRLTTLNEY